VVNFYRHLKKLGFPQVFQTNQLKVLFILSLLATLLHVMPEGGAAEAIRLQQVAQALPNSQAWTDINTKAAVPLTRQGNQILLNGRSLPAVWSQKQQQIGISDAALSQSFGLDLLDTSHAARQPIQWFSQPTVEPFGLSTWFTRQYRYLDITDLAQRQGWQVRATNSTLQISTPPSQITGIRQGRQSWGDRIVVDLERATPWRVSAQGGEMIVAIDAPIEPSLVRSFTAVPGNRLTALKVETNGSQTLIRVESDDRPQISTLPDPCRLLIDIRPDVARTRSIAWAPGIRWQSQTVRAGNAQFPIESLVIDPRQPGISLKPIWGNPETAIGTAPLVTIAQRWQAVAAINGGFFNRNNQLPLGAIRQDRRWLSGPILNRGAIAWNNAGEIAIGRLSLQDSLLTANGQRFPLLSLNSGYVQAGIARYTADWGATYTPILDREVLITVQDDRVISQRSSNAAGQNPVPIPANGYLLVVRSNSAAVAALAVGTGVSHHPILTPAQFDQFPQILGAGPLLIQNQQIVLDAQSEQFSDGFIRQAAIRSAVGTLTNGNLLLVTVQNRLGGSGPTLREVAEVMQRLGAVNALNLDGGSSTTLYLGGQLLNRSPQTAARVHNGLGIFIQPP
jgi:exopolysaccharide biosynthesis protein